ncbi:MAG: histidine kinase [Dermatophilaceae bacterium]
MSRPDRATDDGVQPEPTRSPPPGARMAFLASAAVSLVVAVSHLRPPLPDGYPSAIIQALVVIPVVAACALFVRVQLRLVRAEDDTSWPWVILGLGLVATVPTGQYWALAPGAAAAILRLGVRPALAALGGSALTALGGSALTALGGSALAALGGSTVAGDRIDRPIGAAAADLLVQAGVPALLLAALTRLALDLHRPRGLPEQLLRHHVDLERDRVARDAHDLMGRTLVTASIRTERVLRALGTGDPTLQVKVHRLRETLAAGERRVRALASQPVISTWDDELGLARALCARLGITLTVDERHPPPSHYRALAGLVLRECVTVAISLRATVHVDATVQVTPDDATVVRVVVTRAPGGPAVTPPTRVLEAVDQTNGSLTVSDGDHAWALEVCLPAAHPGRPFR